MSTPRTRSAVSNLREDIVGIHQQVPLLDGSSRPYVYLDNAASTPTLGRVQKKVNEILEWYSSVHRGSGFKSLLCTRVHEEAREMVAGFVGADARADCVIFGKNTTEAINKLANLMQFGPEDVVITTVMEHHSDDLPWRRKAHVVYAELGDEGSLDLDDLLFKLRKFAGRVRLVAVTGASNVTGFMPPIYDIAELAHQYGAQIFVDCAQLAPHRPISMGPVEAPRRLDFVALSAHKMYAPFGTGALVGPKEFFRQSLPDYTGGGTIEVVTLKEVHWAEPPDRHEAGSPNLIGAVALAASIGTLSETGMEVIQAHEADLTRYALQRLGSLENVRLYGSSNPERLGDRLGVISFLIDGIPHGKVAAILGFEGGIGVRSGCFCAHPYVIHLLRISEHSFEVFKQQVLSHDRSQLPGLVRISFGCYNTFEEIDRLIEMVERIVMGDYQGQYEVDQASGIYYPRTFDPSILETYFRL